MRENLNTRLAVVVIVADVSSRSVRILCAENGRGQNSSGRDSRLDLKLTTVSNAPKNTRMWKLPKIFPGLDWELTCLEIATEASRERVFFFQSVISAHCCGIRSRISSIFVSTILYSIKQNICETLFGYNETAREVNVFCPTLE